MIGAVWIVYDYLFDEFDKAVVESYETSVAQEKRSEEINNTRIKIGMTMNEIYDLFGEPDDIDTSLNKKGEEQSWRYYVPNKDSHSFHFDRNEELEYYFH